MNVTTWWEALLTGVAVGLTEGAIVVSTVLAAAKLGQRRRLRKRGDQ